MDLSGGGSGQAIKHDIDTTNSNIGGSARKSYGTQVRYLRKLEPPSDPLLWLQIFLVLGVCFAAYVVLDIWQAAVWAVVYTSFQLIEKLVLRLVSDEATFAEFSIILTVLFVEACIYCAMPIYLWTLETDVAKFGALALLTAAAMHSTLNRAAYRSILSCFLVPTAGAFLAIAAWSSMTNLDSGAAIIFPLIGLAITAFFIVSLLQANQKEVQANVTAIALSQAQKFDTVGKLTAGIAHDFNNLLSVVQGSLELLEDAETEAARKQLIKQATLATESGAKLTQQMLAFGRRAPLLPRVVDTSRIVNDVKQLATRVIPSSVSIRSYIEPEIDAVSVDEGAFQAALLNLILNASYAMPSGGKLTIEARNTESSKGFKQAVQVVVADTGIGIPAADLERVFDPFFTTRETGSGSGLGLPMVRGFVDQSGGNLDLISEVGVGTTVKLTFPAVQQQEVSNEKMVESGFTAAESRHILVVDDNEQLLSLISEKLRREGFKITTQPSGDAALDALKQGVQPDLVLSDVVMPGKIQGRELARYVHNLYPKTPVILMSGYADPDEDLGLANLEADDFLQKPVQLAEMVDRIRRLLG